MRDGEYGAIFQYLTLVENLFNTNGWNGTVSGAGSSIFSRNLYISNCAIDVADPGGGSFSG